MADDAVERMIERCKRDPDLKAIVPLIGMQAMLIPPAKLAQFRHHAAEIFDRLAGYWQESKHEEYLENVREAAQ